MNKCKWCGKSFEKSDLNKFIGGASLGMAGGEKYCSKKCEQADAPKSSSSSNSFSSGANASANSNIEADLLEAQLDHEKEMLEEKHEHELRMEHIRASSLAIEKINDLELGGDKPTLESISKQIEFCITTASSSLSETFDDIGYENEREKFNQSEKIANAAIKKAELGLNKLRLCEPQDKALNYFNVYKQQVNEIKIKHIKRSYEMQIKQAKPETWIWFACLLFFPSLIYPIYKTVNALFLIPKKRDEEIKLLKQ